MSTALIWFRHDLRLHDNPAAKVALGDSYPYPIVDFSEKRLKGS